uniref:Uncharacterized protein n=1 Tax=Haptolina ericina TaxID=156174 RepID=A0A7S3BMC1_9EUKA|mmetsp:Transcript_62630/g.139467  ORF Transcript_62630/g.139467 Transcript_62630/m.139467 type:complete len:140 (+) Transcript_62630:1-420(+)
MLRNFGPSPRVISLVSTDEDLRARLAQRRICSACSAPMYPPPEEMAAAAAAVAVTNSTPASQPAAHLYSHMVEGSCTDPSPIRRTLDGGSELAERWRVYHGQTIPLLEQLRSGQADVSEVKLASEPDETWERILEVATR